MKKRLAGIILFCSCFLLVFGVSLWYWLSIVNVYEIPADVRITGGAVIGINLDKDKLHFGSVDKESDVVMRTLYLTNNRTIPVKVVITSKGTLRDILYFLIENQSSFFESGTSFAVSPCSSTKLRVYARPMDADLPVNITINGSIRVLFRKCFPFESGVCREQEIVC